MNFQGVRGEIDIEGFPGGVISSNDRTNIGSNRSEARRRLQVVRHQPSKLTFTGSNPVAPSVESKESPYIGGLLDLIAWKVNF
jgi:hypothetical protein